MNKEEIQNQIRIMKIKNQIQKIRLQNLNKARMIKRAKSIKRIQPLPFNPLMSRPALTIGENHIEPSVNNDLNTAFNADIGHGDTFWGGESYFLGDDYYGEDYFGEENMWTGLGLHGLNFGRGYRPPSPFLY